MIHGSHWVAVKLSWRVPGSLNTSPSQSRLGGRSPPRATDVEQRTQKRRKRTKKKRGIPFPEADLLLLHSPVFPHNIHRLSSINVKESPPGGREPPNLMRRSFICSAGQSEVPPQRALTARILPTAGPRTDSGRDGWTRTARLSGSYLLCTRETRKHWLLRPNEDEFNNKIHLINHHLKKKSSIRGRLDVTPLFVRFTYPVIKITQ